MVVTHSDSGVIWIPIFTALFGCILGMISQIYIEVFKTSRKRIAKSVEEAAEWIDQILQHLGNLQDCLLNNSIGDIEERIVPPDMVRKSDSLSCILSHRLSENIREINRVVKGISFAKGTFKDTNQLEYLRSRISILMNELRYWQQKYSSTFVFSFRIKLWKTIANRRFSDSNAIASTL